MNEAVKSIQPVVTQNGNTIRVNCPEALGVYADKEKVSQVVSTLLDNACKNTRRGTISVSVAREIENGNEWIRFSVQDTGSGIPPEQLADLFGPFTQTDHTRAHEFGGTGLSLPLSQRYCKMMRGSIQVTSTLGEGLTFTMRLPQHTEQK